jgi:hypothetical protein
MYKEEFRVYQAVGVQLGAQQIEHCIKRQLYDEDHVHTYQR